MISSATNYHVNATGSVMRVTVGSHHGISERGKEVHDKVRSKGTYIGRTGQNYE
jgi:hypothetical protein